VCVGVCVCVCVCVCRLLSGLLCRLLCRLLSGLLCVGLLWWSSGKNLPAKARDMDLIPDLGISNN